MLQAILGYLNQKHMSSMEDKREGRLYVDNRHARGRSAPVEGTHQEPMVRLHGGVVRLDALDAFDFTVFLLMGNLYRAALLNDERADVDYRRFHPDGP
jgi:hypothetical protein